MFQSISRVCNGYLITTASHLKSVIGLFIYISYELNKLRAVLQPATSRCLRLPIVWCLNKLFIILKQSNYSFHFIRWRWRYHYIGGIVWSFCWTDARSSGWSIHVNNETQRFVFITAICCKVVLRYNVNFSPNILQLCSLTLRCSDQNETLQTKQKRRE